MFKNILFGLGGVGVVGGGGYMIYNATRSGEEGSKEKDSKSGEGSAGSEEEPSPPGEESGSGGSTK